MTQRQRKPRAVVPAADEQPAADVAAAEQPEQPEQPVNDDDTDAAVAPAADEQPAAELVRVRILQGVAGLDFSWGPGEVVDMTEAKAGVWADGYRAELVD